MAGHVGGAPVLEHDLDLPPKFWANFELPDDDRLKDDCWLWTGILWKSGYGRWNQHNWGYWVHRIMYAVYREPIPEGMAIDHLCMTKACGNPYHLEVCTPQENTRRWAEQTIQACPQGHPYTPDNVGKGVHRRCLTCHRDRERKRRIEKLQTPAHLRPKRHAGRPVSTHTKIGYLIYRSGLRVYEVCGLAGISYEYMTLYTTGRKKMAPHHARSLAEVFGVDPEDVVGLRHAKPPSTNPPVVPGGDRGGDRPDHRPAGAGGGGLRGRQGGSGPDGRDVPAGPRQSQTGGAGLNHPGEGSPRAADRGAPVPSRQDR
jgi:hypothetical protein